MKNQQGISRTYQQMQKIKKTRSINWLERFSKMGVDLQATDFSYALALLIMFMTWFLLIHMIVIKQILQLEVSKYLKQLLSQNLIGLYCISISFKLIIAINLKVKLVSKNNYSQKKQFLKIISSHIPEITQIDYCLSALILYQQFIYGFCNFFVASVFACIQSVFLSNNFAFNLTSYISSSRKNLELRLLSIIGWVFLSLSSFYDLQVLNIIIAFALYSSSLFFWHLYKGYTLFVNKRLRKILLLMISTSLALSLVTIQMCFLRNPLSLKGFLMKYIAMNALILYSLRSTLRQNKDRYKQMSLEEINYEFYQNNQNDLDYKSWILGYIKITNKQNAQYLNSKQNILNGQNRIHQQQIHDTQLALKKMISQRFQVLIARNSLFYGQNRNNQNVSHYKNKLLIEYGRFLLNQTVNYNKASLILSSIEFDSIDLFQRISVYQLRILIMQRYLRINHEKDPQIEKVFEFEEQYEQIWMIMKELMMNYQNAFIYLHNQQIDIDKFKKIFGKIDDKQQICSKLFIKHRQFNLLNRKFHFLFIFYKRFIENKQIQKHQIQVEKKKYIFLQGDKHHFFDDWLFNKQNIIFSCRNQQQKLLITNINKQFTNILLYGTQEVVNKPVQILMQPQVALDHYHKFALVIFKEEFTYGLQQNNNMIQTFCLDKQSSPIPVLKYYKIHVNNASQLQFICLMKCESENVQNINKKMFYLQKLGQIIKNTSETITYNQYQPLKLDSKSIFYKENDQLPRQQSPEIFKIKLLIFGLLILFFGQIILLNNIFTEEIIIFNDNLNKYILIMQCYRKPVGLGSLYLRSIINLGNQTVLQEKISSLKQSFRNTTLQVGVKEALFDKKFNQENVYYPIKGSINMNKTYDQVDIFYLILSQTVSLSQSPIKINSLEFQTFNDYIIPSYDNLINGTKITFHNLYQESIIDLKNKIFVIMLLQSITALVFIFLMVKIILKFKFKLNLIFLTMLNLQKKQIDGIIQFWRRKQAYLYHFRKQQIQQQVSNQIAFQKCNQSNLNRKRKNILPEKRKVNYIFVLSAVIFMAIFIIIIYFNISYSSQLNQLAIFQNQGFNFLKYFPITPIVNYGLLAKYTHLLFPKNISFDNEIYLYRVEALRLFGQNNYITDDQDDTSSLFFKARRNYFFGNPCTYNPTILNRIGINQTTCETVFEGSLKNGLAFNFRSIYALTSKYFNNVIKIDKAGLHQFDLMTTIVSSYVLDLITILNNEFKQRLFQLEDNLSRSLIIGFTLIAVFSMIFFIYLLKKLNKEHKYYNKMFKNMIPSEYLVSQKVIRQQFINNQIL